MTDHRLILKLQTPERQAVHERILAAGLSDEQTYAAELLLAMASDGNRMRISTWVALELFELTMDEWFAAVRAITRAGLATAEWDNNHAHRVTITFIDPDREPDPTPEDTNHA